MFCACCRRSLRDKSVENVDGKPPKGVATGAPWWGVFELQVLDLEVVRFTVVDERGGVAVVVGCEALRQARGSCTAHGSV